MAEKSADRADQPVINAHHHSHRPAADSGNQHGPSNDGALGYCYHSVVQNGILSLSDPFAALGLDIMLKPVNFVHFSDYRYNIPLGKAVLR